MIVILMGVTGAGKTVVGQLLAHETGSTFADADDFHPASNRAKLAAGTPLTDDDRQPWLECLHSLLVEWDRAQKGGVLACSALKAKYRATLMENLTPGAAVFVLLDGSRELIAGRLANRREHFMNPALLDSQFATLEDPGKDAVRVSNAGTPEETVRAILAGLRARNEVGSER